MLSVMRINANIKSTFSQGSPYKNPDSAGYLLDIQADLLNYLNARIVVPLLPLDLAPKPAAMLNLESRRHDITVAVDLLFQGF